MKPRLLIHQRPNFRALIDIVAVENEIGPAFVEKDYRIVHCLYCLKEAGYEFKMKGGTTLSKGFRVIERFSEYIAGC